MLGSFKRVKTKSLLLSPVTKSEYNVAEMLIPPWQCMLMYTEQGSKTFTQFAWEVEDLVTQCRFDTKPYTKELAIKDVMGRSRKYPPQPRTTLNWVPKSFRISKKDNSIYAGFQTLLIQNLGEFQNFGRFWMVLLEFRSKLTKF